jgi:diacylglycerol kinase (ATP)
MRMRVENDTVFRHIVKAFFWSMAGIRAAWKSELSFRTQTVVIVIMLPFGIWLGRTAVEWALLIGSCSLILITELLNTAVETVIDRISFEEHKLSKQAKDLGSAAAFFSMTAAVVVWGLIAYERFFG